MENSRPSLSPRWFRQWGWIHRPDSALGVVVTLLPAAFSVQVFIAVDRHAHSASDTLYGVYPCVVSTFLLWSWIAQRTAKP